MIVVETWISVERSTIYAYQILNKFAATPEMIAPESIPEESITRMETVIKYFTVELFCVKCGDWGREQKIDAIPAQPQCGRYRSGLLATLKYSNDHIKTVVKK